MAKKPPKTKAKPKVDKPAPVSVLQDALFEVTA